MKLPTYQEALTMGKEAITEALAPIKASRAKKQAELEMLKIEEDMATTQAEVAEECCKEKISFPKIIELQDKLGLLERRKKQYQEILEQMFPENTK